MATPVKGWARETEAQRTCRPSHSHTRNPKACERGREGEGVPAHAKQRRKQISEDGDTHDKKKSLEYGKGREREAERLENPNRVLLSVRRLLYV